MTEQVATRRDRDRPATPPIRWQRDAKRLLADIFGLERLRTGQLDVIRNVMAGQDTLAIMPTGAGKSLCYQLPALMLPGRTVVVSPLIALMKDQCDRLRQAGVAAVQLNSALGADERDEAEEAVASGEARIVFSTPERLAAPEFRQLLAAAPTSLLVIDEAHCISQWGHDFRPSFLEVGAALSALGRPTLLALTATASDDVADDIAEQLGVPTLARVATSVYRPNLHYGVEQFTNDDEKRDRLLAIVAAEAGPTIVYASTVKAVDELHAALVERGESVGRYHGKLPSKERARQQDAFMCGDRRVMVATNAFGLGIDRPDVRAVVHYQMPGGLDAYYQESGRAGRDGEDARCTLLFLADDKAVQRFFMAGRYPAFDDLEAIYLKLVEAPADGGRWTLDTLQAALDRPRAKVQVGLALLRRERVVSQRKDGGLARATPRPRSRRGGAAAGGLPGEARPRSPLARADGVLRPDRLLPLAGPAAALRRVDRLRALRHLRQLRADGGDRRGAGRRRGRRGHDRRCGRRRGDTRTACGRGVRAGRCGEGAPLRQRRRHRSRRASRRGVFPERRRPVVPRVVRHAPRRSAEALSIALRRRARRRASRRAGTSVASAARTGTFRFGNRRGP